MVQRERSALGCGWWKNSFRVIADQSTTGHLGDFDASQTLSFVSIYSTIGKRGEDTFIDYMVYRAQVVTLCLRLHDTAGTCEVETVPLVPVIMIGASKYQRLEVQLTYALNVKQRLGTGKAASLYGPTYLSQTVPYLV